MYIVLTDHLRCPRCGPEHGLVLLAERLEARRVLEGVLGCANCREKYPVRGGFADLRGGAARGGDGGAGEHSGVAAGAAGGAEEVMRLAAMMGVTGGPGFVLVAGPAAGFAAELARLVEGVEVVAVGDALADQPEEAGVSRIGVGAELPLASGSMRAVALTGDGGGIALEEAARVVARLGRLAVEGAGAGVRERLERMGFRVLVEKGAQLVAVRA
ncbi:MAG TPA: hypothetical protein VIL18_12220 [Longimicrobiales bacterium]